MAIFYFKPVMWRSKEIKVVKLRTMCEDADRKLASLIKSNGLDDLGKIKNGPRITPLGRILRTYWIDEVPQLVYNICIKHDMHLVGLRPRTEKEWALYPLDIKEKQRKYKYGLISPTYMKLTKSFEEQVELERRYLQKKEICAWKTDLECFFKVMGNIVFKGIRSR